MLFEWKLCFVGLPNYLFKLHHGEVRNLASGGGVFIETSSSPAYRVESPES